VCGASFRFTARRGVHKAAGAYEVFADGFALNRAGRGGGNHRPTGLAQGPDGSLYVADDALGRIYKIVYTRM